MTKGTTIIPYTKVKVVENQQLELECQDGLPSIYRT
jgi:hypothetical protein